MEELQHSTASASGSEAEQKNSLKMALSSQIEEATSAYRELLKYSSVVTAVIQEPPNSELISVEAVWSQRMLEKSSQQTYSRSYLLDKDFKPINTTPPQILLESLWKVYSPSHRQFARLSKYSKDSTKKGDEKWHLEIWRSDGSCDKIIDLTALNKHGAVYGDDDAFGCIQWNKQEDKILYVAEKKQPTYTSFFDRHAKDKDGEAIIKGDQYIHREDWGELLVDKRHPAICVCDLNKETIDVIQDEVLQEYSSGQAVWCPDGMGIVFCSYVHSPQRLGIIYCPIRRSVLNHYNTDTQTLTFHITSTTEDKTDLNKSVHSARFSPDGTKLVYLQCEAGGPHCHSLQLQQMNWPSRQISTLIDTVPRSTDNEFYGFYSSDMAAQCWSADSTKVFIATPALSYKEIFCVDVATGSIHKLTESIGSWSVIDISNNIILAHFSSIEIPPRLMIGRLTYNPDSKCKVNWTVVGENRKVEGITWETITHKPQIPHPIYDYLTYQSVVIHPTCKETKGLILLPHGGPHSQFPSGWLLFFAALAKLGFTLVLVNYRGSTGFGDESIYSLTSNIGEQDVKDVHQAALDVLNKYNITKERVVVLGGSHGGFLGAQLIGQYPEFYKAAVLRNPVTNLVSMLSGTDIPDWAHTEIGNDYTIGRTPSQQIYERLYKQSPIAHIAKVKTPTLIMLGSDDKRVPPYNGKEFYKALIAQGTEAKLLVYPDNSHPINSVDAHSDGFMNLYLWFITHLPQ